MFCNNKNPTCFGGEGGGGRGEGGGEGLSGSSDVWRVIRCRRLDNSGPNLPKFWPYNTKEGPIKMFAAGLKF
jgi:hypothetical protein